MEGDGVQRWWRKGRTWGWMVKNFGSNWQLNSLEHWGDLWLKLSFVCCQVSSRFPKHEKKNWGMVDMELRNGPSERLKAGSVEWINNKLSLWDNIYSRSCWYWWRSNYRSYPLLDNHDWSVLEWEIVINLRFLEEG